MNLPRAGWRKDAKWICSIIFTFLLFADLGILSLYRITSPQNARSMWQRFLVNSVSEEMRVVYEQARLEAKVRPGHQVAIPFLPFITMSSKELRTMSFSEFQDRVATAVFDRIYQGEPIVLSSQAEQAIPPQILSLLSFFSEKNHVRLGKLLFFLSFLTFVFLALTLIFSYRFGKCFTVGVCFSLASFPGLLFSLALLRKGSYSAFGSIGLVIRSDYLVAFILGLCLMIVGLVGGIILRIIQFRAEEPKLIADGGNEGVENGG
jgi:hypothetical protein